MELFPPMTLASWRDTKETLHRYCQVVGKLRLAASVRRNHWWNVPFHLTGRGTTTRPMGQVDGNPILCIDFVIPVICRPACSMRSISGFADRPAQECGASRLLLAAWEFGPRVRPYKSFASSGDMIGGRAGRMAA